MATGLALYVAYRKVEAKPLLRRVTIHERALRHEALEPEFGSLLVPIFGTPLDDDIVQTAGRLAGETSDDVSEEGAMIEAIWVFEMPLSLPLDAPLPEAQISRARGALARAKQVGRSTRGSRWPRLPCALAGQVRRSSPRPAGAGWRRSFWRLRSLLACGEERFSVASVERATARSARSPAT